jgi:hypothetical protein
LISPAGDWIFVHIQKTGGNSVRAALGAPLDDPHKHRTAVELRDIYGVRAWNAARIRFSFVRNPWERLVSWWTMIDHGRREPNRLMPFQRWVASRARTFAEFLLLCGDDYEDADGRKGIYRNQIEYLVDREGVPLVDFVGRFERLESDFAAIASAIGRPELTLPHLNRSPRDDYTEYYSASLRDLVGDRYRQDIEAFGYSFDSEVRG